MLAIELLVKHYKDEQQKEGTIEQVCNICGKTKQCVKAIQSGNFTNWDLLKNRDSKYTCVECASVVKGKKNKIRQSSWIANEKEMHWLAKQDIIKYLLNPIDPPFVFYATTSYKKNGYFIAPVNYSRKKFQVLFEELVVDCDLEIMEKLVPIVEDMYIFFTFEEIRTGNYNVKQMMRYGKKKFMLYEEMLKPFRGTGMFELIVHSVNSITPADRKVLQEKKEVKSKSKPETQDSKALQEKYELKTENKSKTPKKEIDETQDGKGNLLLFN